MNSLAAGISKLFTQTGTPIPAVKLEPLIAAVVKLGDGCLDKFADELAEKITDKVKSKLAGKVAEIRFPRS